MKVLVIHGSMRKTGNTKILADEFMRGAQKAGHETELVELRDQKIGDCFGCRACMKNGGKCVQKDDMAGLIDKMKAADAVVLACPQYYFTWTGLMKRFLDRTYPLLPILSNTSFYLITVGGVSDKKLLANMEKDFELYVACFSEFNHAANVKAAGAVLGTSALDLGAIRGTAAMQEAYEMGKNLK